MKHYISNILSINNKEILIITTVTGSLLQIICRRYEKLHPELESDHKPDQIESKLKTNKRHGKSRLTAIRKFLSKNGLKVGFLSGAATQDSPPRMA